MLLTDKKNFQHITKNTKVLHLFHQKWEWQIDLWISLHCYGENVFILAGVEGPHPQADRHFILHRDPGRTRWSVQAVEKQVKIRRFHWKQKKFKNLIIVHNLKPYGFLKQNVLYYDLKSNTVQNKSQISLAVELCTTHRWTSNKMHSLWSLYLLFNNKFQIFLCLPFPQSNPVYCCVQRQVPFLQVAPLWQMFWWRQGSDWMSHLLPVNPVVQLQLNPFSPSVQEPPFWQGPDSHVMMSSEQLWPV